MAARDGERGSQFTAGRQLTLRDRVLTPKVARTITSPTAILLAGAGTAVAIVAGLPIAVAGVVGLAAYGARVAAAIGRKPPPQQIDPNQLTEPWRGFVFEALVSQRRFAKAITRTASGPLRDRLTDIGSRIDDGVRECWTIANRGQQLQGALRELEDPRELRRRIEAARHDAGFATGEARERTLASLEAQLASTERVAAITRDTAGRLQALDARLDEAVARAVELSVSAGDATDLGGLGEDVDALVGDMEALRQALEETSGGAMTGAQ